MSRLILPVRFADWTDLFKKMKEKHDADGAASVLNAFLAENEIDLTVDEGMAADAVALNILFDKKEKEAEKLFEKRDTLFDPVWEEHTKCAQFLKKFYYKNIHKLGDYGITVNGNKIVYPAGFDNRKLAAVALIDKHLGFVPITNSPLNNFITAPENNIDLAQNKLDASEAKDQHDLAEQANREKEKYRAERDKKINPVKINIERIGGLIVKLFSNNPKKAGDWGFVVDDSPRKPKLRNTKLKLAGARTLSGVVIGGMLTVLHGSVSIYKGKATTGIPTVLNKGEKMGIPKGFSTITVVNNSNLDAARVNMLRAV